MSDEIKPLTDELRRALIACLCSSSGVTDPLYRDSDDRLRKQLDYLRAINLKEMQIHLPKHPNAKVRVCWLFAALARTNLDPQMRAWLEQILAEESL